MKIAWVNRFDDGAVTAGSRVSSLPPENLQNPHLAVKWHSEGGVNNTHVVADLGASSTVDCVAAIGANLTASATLRVRASDTDSTGADGAKYDSGALNSVISDSYKNFYHSLSSTITARYWRVDFNDSTLNNIRVGRLFIGPAWTPTKEMLFGWALTWADNSRRTKSRGGQSYIDLGPRFRILDFTLSFMGQSEMYNNAFELARRNGTNEDVLVIPDEDSSFLSEFSVFGLVSGALPLTHANFNVYRQRYRIEERL